jgi:hypothetical protein
VLVNNKYRPENNMAVDKKSTGGIELPAARCYRK